MRELAFFSMRVKLSFFVLIDKGSSLGQDIKLDDTRVKPSSLRVSLSKTLRKLSDKGFVILYPKSDVSNPSVSYYLVSDGDQWCDSVSSARVDPALNGYLEKSGEDK